MKLTPPGIEMMPLRAEFVMVKQGRKRDFESAAREPATSAPWSSGVVVAEGPAHSGKRSAVLRRPAAKRAPKGKRRMPTDRLRVDPLPVLEARTRYRLEAWVKAEGPGTQVWLCAQPSEWTPRPYDGPKLEPVKSEIAPGDSSWQKLVLEFVTPPEHGRSPQLFLKAQFSWEGGAVYLDDLLFNKLKQDDNAP